MNVGAIGGYTPVSYIYPTSPVSATQKVELGIPKDSNKVDKTDPNYKCQTCENRKYQDGSNESDVSFKCASKVAPESAAGAGIPHRC